MDMRISLELELKDKPGQLVNALEPISRLGGNIVSVVHIREEIKGERVPVHVIFDVDNHGRLEKILKELEARDVLISKIGEEKKKGIISIMLIGHVVDTDLKDTLDRINEIGAKVIDLDLEMPHPEKESSAKMNIEISEDIMKKKVFEVIEKIAEEKNLLVIKSLEA